MKLLNIIIASAFLFLVGCASAPMAPSDLDQKAKSFENSSDKATLYIYRNENFGAAISMEVLVNNKSIGQTAAKTYFKYDVTPGHYQIQSKAENTSILDLDVLAGKSYFVWQEVKMGFIYARNKLQLTDEIKGKAGVLESKLINTPITSTMLSDSVDTTNGKDLTSKLTELKSLKDAGSISEDEYQQSKTKLLGEFK